MLDVTVSKEERTENMIENILKVCSSKGHSRAEAYINGRIASNLAFIIEMICDHWSFSWKSNNLYEVFDWYEKKKSNMLLSDKTRKTYEHILKLIKETLGEMKYEKS